MKEKDVHINQTMISDKIIYRLHYYYYYFIECANGIRKKRKINTE